MGSKLLATIAAAPLTVAPAIAMAQTDNQVAQAAGTAIGVSILVFGLIGFIGWIVTLVVICKRQTGAAVAGLIILSLFFWPLALVISLCMGKPQPTIIYNLAPGQLPPQC